MVYEQILKQDFKDKSEVVLGINDSWDFNHLITFNNSELDTISSFNTTDYYSIVPHEIDGYYYIFISSLL